MRDLFDLLRLLRTYAPPPRNGIDWIPDVDPDSISAEDLATIEELGFNVHDLAGVHEALARNPDFRRVAPPGEVDDLMRQLRGPQ